MSRAIFKNLRGGHRPEILSITYNGSWIGDSVNRTVYDFNSRNIGNAPTTGQRRFLIGFGHVVRDGLIDLTDLKINGTSATTLLNVEQGSTAALRIAMREVNSGSTANLQITNSNSASFASGAFLSIITNGANLQKVDEDFDDSLPYSMTFDGNAGDAIIAASTLQQAGPHTWGGPAAMTERYDDVVQSGYSSAFAGLLSTGGLGLNVTGSVPGGSTTRIGGLVVLRPVTA